MIDVMVSSRFATASVNNTANGTLQLGCVLDEETVDKFVDDTENVLLAV